MPMSAHPARLIVLVASQRRDGREIYSYLRLEKEQLKRLEGDIQQQNVLNLYHYGEVLLAVEGVPSEETQTYLQKRYHFSHEAV